MEQQIRFCTTSDGVRIAYATAGEGPPLVVITPWVGRVRGPVSYAPDGHEIARVIEVPFARLVDPAALRVEHWERDGLWREMYFWDLEDGDVIWGATARILKHYLDVLAGG